MWPINLNAILCQSYFFISEDMLQILLTLERLFIQDISKDGDSCEIVARLNGKIQGANNGFKHPLPSNISLAFPGWYGCCVSSVLHVVMSICIYGLQRYGHLYMLPV